MLSELARKGLETQKRKTVMRNGVPVFASRGPGARRVTMQLVNELRDDDL
jgi:hypothetical protein